MTEGEGENNFKKYVDEFFEGLTLYDDYYNGHRYKDLLKASIDVFLENESTYSAYDIYQTFFMIYQITSENKSAKKDKENEKEGAEKIVEDNSVPKNLINEPNTLLDLVKIMKGYEENTGDLIEKQRDHFIHSVNVFLLGLAIYSKNNNYQDFFYDYVINSGYTKYFKIDGEFSNEEFLYRWGIASLFHDIGYPVEIIGKQLKQFIKEGIQPISPDYSVNMGIDFKNFDEFNHILKICPNFADKYLDEWDDVEGLDLFKPTDIMAHKIAREFDVDIKSLKMHLDNFPQQMNEDGFIDHGFFSSILVLDSYGYLIQKYAKKSDFFFYPIVDSATAILLHNYYANTLNNKNYEQFQLGLMDPRDNPLAFLLKLCDELQEWNRQPFGFKDKQRSHVNELHIDIDDYMMNVEYIIKHGSMGIDFSSKKENKDLKDVLDIKKVFRNDLKVHTRIEKDKTRNIEEDAMRNIVKKDIQAPEVLARNVEKLAIEIHNKYNETVENQYFDLLMKIHENPTEFEEKRKEYIEKISDMKYQSFDFKEGDPIFKEIEELEKEYKAEEVKFEKEALAYLSEEYLDFEKNHKIVDELEKKFKDDEEEFGREASNYLTKEYLEQRNKYEEIGELNSVISEMEDIKAKYDVNKKEIDRECDDCLKYYKLKERRDELISKGVDKDEFDGIKFYNFKKKYEEIIPFDELTPQFKMSNIRQARSIPKKLAMIGCELAHKDDERDAVLEFSEEEITDLAILEHDDWCEEREGTGWTLGPKKDEKKLITPYLVPWTELDPEIQEYDKDPVRNIPAYAKSIGLKIVRTKIRLLTIEMHNKHEEEILFKDLSPYIKYSNYKYTDFLVKNLAQEGYNFVPIDEPGDAVIFGKDDEGLIREICIKEHNEWCLMRERLGWSYGKERDDEKMINPNLVPWNLLRRTVRDANMNTIKQLPELCEKVGLKIVKNK